MGQNLKKQKNLYLYFLKNKSLNFVKYINLKKFYFNILLKNNFKLINKFKNYGDLIKRNNVVLKKKFILNNKKKYLILKNVNKNKLRIKRKLIKKNLRIKRKFNKKLNKKYIFKYLQKNKKINNVLKFKLLFKKRKQNLLNNFYNDFKYYYKYSPIDIYYGNLNFFENLKKLISRKKFLRLNKNINYFYNLYFYRYKKGLKLIRFYKFQQNFVFLNNLSNIFIKIKLLKKYIRKFKLLDNKFLLYKNLLYKEYVLKNQLIYIKELKKLFNKIDDIKTKNKLKLLINNYIKYLKYNLINDVNIKKILLYKKTLKNRLKLFFMLEFISMNKFKKYNKNANLNFNVQSLFFKYLVPYFNSVSKFKKKKKKISLRNLILNSNAKNIKQLRKIYRRRNLKTKLFKKDIMLMPLKKNFLYLYINRTKNNLFLTIVNPKINKVLLKTSIGMLKIKNFKRIVKYAYTEMGLNFGKLYLQKFAQKNINFIVFFNGIYSRLLKRVIFGLSNSGLKIRGFRDFSPRIHNGCRKKKKRRK